MKCVRRLATVGLLLLCASVSSRLQAETNRLSEKEVSGGWLLLFDGESTFGWKPRGASQWACEKGRCATSPVRGRLPKHDHGVRGLQLHAEFWIDDKANSGVFLRCPASWRYHRDERLRGEYLRST